MRSTSVDQHVTDYVARLHAAVDALPRDALVTLGDMLFRAYQNGKQVLTLGNGGSASTASHMSADLGKNTIKANMRRFRVLSLNDNVSLLTALANDVGYENVFSEQLKNLIRPGDLLIVISASGNSPNVLEAIRCAQATSAEVAGLLGFGGGEAARMVDLAIVIESSDYGVVEDLHLIINHILVEHFQLRLADDESWVV
ncbi:MAG: SIS domain-containing protein [Solirubrobacterales bacterium]|nr:SIS domain-containing protein [Solirubrobacterales bacterium]